MSFPKRLKGFDNVTLTALDETITKSDVVLLLVDYKEFKTLPQEHLVSKPVVGTKEIWR
ncbi:hypothetical protein [Corynebacterium phoceense]|uniref:hypothetical protein n=1 Tax=Corynebacterium phoceense TaxID=1686286 RepID=UPI0015EF5C15|nr:hypothetical protein [Corynebacterium phoceense]